MINIPTHQQSLLDSDTSILAKILSDLDKYQTIRAVDIGSFSVAVDKGSVLLTGHVSKKYHHDLIEEIARSTAGVSAVRNDLVVDSDLTIQVAKSLSGDEQTRRFIIPVGCVHGWIRLGGEVSNHAIQLAAEEIAVQIPNVRGVLSLPRIPGGSLETERQALQPRVSSRIYDYHRQEGVVSQVVIQPRNRLVTHIVVTMGDFENGMVVSHKYVIPLESVDVVNPDSLFVKRNERPLHTFPVFDVLEYPLAPSHWQPPYPYIKDEVRWPCEQPNGAESSLVSYRSVDIAA